MQPRETQPNLRGARDQSPLGDPVIKRYRWALVASHAVVLLYFADTNILSFITNRTEPLCWPYFQDCWRIRFATDSSLTILMLVQAFLIIIAASMLAAKYYRAYWWVMVLLNGYLFAIVSLDYRLRGNQFYMLFWLNAVVLFWPAKRWATPLILMSFYFWAGTLKLNYEWLSGSVLYHGLYIVPERYTWLACVYVVVLEMVIIQGLLAKRAWIRWLALGQLVLFHVESLSQIHWFYPLLMAALLSWFVIDWTATGRSSPTVSLANLWRGRAPRSAYLLIAVFAGFQLAPYVYHGDKSLTGQGRVFALDMLEARQVCDVHALVHFTNSTSDELDLLMPELPPRKVCDPIVYYNRVRNLCRLYAGTPGFADVDFVMHSRRTTDNKPTTIVDESNFCGRRDVYNLFSNNSWIK